jgi:hypothetical protein
MPIAVPPTLPAAREKVENGKRISSAKARHVKGTPAASIGRRRHGDEASP